MPMRPVNSSAVVTREHPFFDPGASSSVMSPSLVTEGTGPTLVQTTGEPALLIATHPVQGPGTSDVATQPLQAPGAEIATQSLQAPGAGTANQPPQAPGAGPEVLPTGIDSMQLNKSLPGV